MGIPSAPRIGLVVPPENPNAEPEYTHLLGRGPKFHTTRFPTTPDSTLREMLDTYNEVLPDVLAGFGRLPLDAAVVACSASHYLHAPDGDLEFCARLTARTGYPVRSSALATLDACRALDLTALTLVSPYEPWLTELSRSYWERAGITVERVVQVSADGRYDPYTVTTGGLLAELRRQRVPEDSPLLFTGTGMFTLDALAELGTDPDRVLLSSNLAGVWWALRAAGADPGGPEDHPLLRRLARRAVAA
ncbi:maleate cis-trans isomerase family protein [Kitasatospora phosalacinea]|uniref:maleate cis-trans isomerase family protein n=1 Tax=Kitasatospora phosalacinea TaxID=2065 RepID=UPI0005276645|nr:arylmalonate decarboxylase [Kitasatospora phosalacinea]